MNHAITSVLHKRAVVLLLLFCVMGPLAWRLLWSSPAFKTPERLTLSLLSLLEFCLIAYLLSRGYTAYLLGIGADGPT